ncbi:neutral and basic amino acid transport protein rBAT-like isoform X3 [Belonocnema kinseyi]|nr:neutral and basic amino acid transport protein rBAT-like isoform X3 [Belonocnema kinseyi]
MVPIFNRLEDPLELSDIPTVENINSEDGLNVFMNIVNSSSKPLHDEPSSRDPMLESTSSSNSSIQNEPVCAQLLTQLNTAYQHLAPDAQALFYNQENGGKPPLVGIQLVVPKPPKNYRFTNWNWPLIRKTCFWSMMSILAGCAALVIGVIITMPKKCDPPVEWWQGSLFYEIFPASYQDDIEINDGIGDLPGISNRLDYLHDLGVQGVRLNSIFPAPHYPEYYFDVTNLTNLNEHLGKMQDFDHLVKEIHARNMTLILDLPLYPLIKDLNESKSNRSEPVLMQSRKVLPDVIPSTPQTSLEVMGNFLTSKKVLAYTISDEDDSISSVIRFWIRKGVDGFYLKGLEHYVNEESFPEKLRFWKSITGSNRILICNIKALNEAKKDEAKNAILLSADLVDVTVRVSNGTEDIKAQINQVLDSVLFEKLEYPWVQWSVGNIDTKRVASTLSVSNASVAVTLMAMMLPGTPSIFYGDEKGILDCNCSDHADLEHVHHLSPMHWEAKDKLKNELNNRFSNHAFPWLSETNVSIESSLEGAIKNMTCLRKVTPSIYVKASIKNNKIKASCEIRYTKDELIVIERKYHRRNSYVFVANLGNKTQTKDLSHLYYGGHVVIGPKHKLGQEVFFKELNIPPGEAFVIKLDK